MIRSTLALVLCSAIVATAAPAPVPRPAPNFVVNLGPGGQVTPAQYKGKVVVLAMILTTCPHCQEATRMLSGLQKEYGPRGLQVMAAAFNEMSNMLVPDFIKAYKPTFPVGYSTRNDVLTFLGRSINDEMYVPIMVFIDRKGIIRHQYLGDDPFFSDGEKNIRARIETLLGPVAATKKAAPPATKESPKVTVTVNQ